MPLGSSGLALVALGMAGDAPAVADQPPLVDGNHLRWSVMRSGAFPWYGFYLYRRPSRGRELVRVCLAPDLGRTPGELGNVRHTLSQGVLQGSAPLRLTDDFPTAGQVEIDLRGQESVRFDRDGARPFHHLRVTIGFREAAHFWRCFDFAQVPDRIRLPFHIGGLAFEMPASRRAPRPLTATRHDAGSGMEFGEPFEVALPEASGLVELRFDPDALPKAVEGLDAAGGVVAEGRIGRTDGSVALRAKAIARLRILAGDTPVRIGKICLGLPGAGRKPTVRVEALDRTAALAVADSVVVATETVSGVAGDIVVVELPVSRATGVRISGGDAAIVDICWTEPERQLQGEWQPVPGCPQPLALPVRHPDYPASPGPVDPPAAENEALARILYGPQAAWAGQPFADLHDSLVRLVEGGPASAEMDAPVRAWTDIAAQGGAGGTGPNVLRLHPLDMVLLGSLNRPIAEMLGLSWTDQDAVGRGAYDYMVVADHADAAHGKPEELLEYIGQNGFDEAVDAAIVYDVEASPRAAVEAPAGVRVFALPGGPSRDGGGAIRPIAGAASLAWPSGQTPAGYLAADTPVFHHVYRDSAGGGANPAVPAEARLWLTERNAILNATPMTPPLAPLAMPPGWPPAPPAFVDFALDEGWYVYQVAGVDIFGRFSKKSAFAAWWQWSPSPQPPPWYYAGSGDRLVDPQAVRILDKTRPPVPLGVEASVLDPDDPILVKDAAYAAWRESLGAGGANVIGLRARWRWSPGQQQAAPDVAEFRLYWNAGSAAPAGWAEPAAWSDRVYVCAYAADVRVDADGTRNYDVLLPKAGGGALAAGVPIVPNVLDPVVYANVSVSAADAAAHTADRWTGAGAYVGRVGNESQCAPPARVFRVHRAPPPPPEAVIDGDRVYATPADWHGRSRYTHRWLPRPGLFAHVLRALDEAVFAADWAQQPRPALQAGDAAFPAGGVWNAAKRQQVAAQINAVAPPGGGKAAAFARYRALSDDALLVLANRAGNERAFVQVTVRPLAIEDAPDRRGPNDAAAYVPDAARCAYVDEVDGRARNRLLYRTLFVDGAQNRGAMGPCGTPVRLPDVVPPRAPEIVQALGGDRQVTLRWTSNPEPDLAGYNLYRATDAVAARDIRTMSLIATLAAPADPATRPAQASYVDQTAPGLVDLWYRLVAFDAVDPDPRGGGGNVSPPSPPIRVRAYDQTLPLPPAITAMEWVRLDEGGAVHAYAASVPAGAAWRPAIRVTWDAADAGTRLILQAKPNSAGSFANLSRWLAPGTTSVVAPVDRPSEGLDLRLKVVNAAGNANLAFATVHLDPA